MEYPTAGAATLLAVGLGIESSLERAGSRLGETERRYGPDGESTETYDELYEHYRRTRGDMQPIWERRTELRRVHDSGSEESRGTDEENDQ